MPDYQRNLANIYIAENGSREKYTSPKKGGASKKPPSRNRQEHAEKLKLAFEQAIEDYKEQKSLREPELAVGESGFYLEFQINKKELEALDKLDDRRKKIELVAVRESEESDENISATVFVPEKASDTLPSKVEDYRDKDTDKGNPKNESLITRLEYVNLGTVRALFTDKTASFPSENQVVWWEVWLRKNRIDAFRQVAEILNIRTTRHELNFPEREVVLALTNVTTLSRIIANNDLIAELRLAKDTPSMFFEMDMQEQVSWVKDLTDRIISSPSNNNIAVCLLDSGVNPSHTLIKPFLASDDMLTCDPNWGVEDSKNWRGHGTQIAGIALYGDLLKALATSKKVHLSHCLESVKMLSEQGQNDPKLYGAITKDAAYRAEINKPERQRVFCMAVTSSVDTNGGTPSSWSAAVDQICFEFQRLMVVPVGNIRETITSNDYLAINELSQAENPSQSWNALVVGAYTDKVNIVDSKYSEWQPIASAGDISPRSRTSVLWDDQWSIRPDVTFEGGNLATDGSCSGTEIDDLQLLTTYYQPNNRQFNTFGDTSAANAIASHMGACIFAKHPNYWAETVRGLIVHSAEWTPAMLAHLPKKASQSKKVSILLRRYGYGVPNLERALLSSKSDLTMIVEGEFQPFYKDDGGTIKTKEMNLHVLPWPKKELEKLREAKVEMRVTLSYFIEPNPGERGWQRKHSYASHGLRFGVKRSLETLDDFRKRINKEAREVEENSTSTTSNDNGWFLGAKIWNRGSIHSDIWRGTGAELAQKDAIGIHPVNGWWKYNPNLEGWNKTARYALIVSIRVPNQVDVDIYTPIYNQIQQVVPINIES
ncbi:MAG: S8 family peptidase [Nostocales cyanobacterium 94392]|nr:S8 family peptidase [Nostocales cyanobacterium 94392]